MLFEITYLSLYFIIFLYILNYWQIFFLSLLTVPEVFAKVNSTQLPYRFQNGRHDVI